MRTLIPIVTLTLGLVSTPVFLGCQTEKERAEQRNVRSREAFRAQLETMPPAIDTAVNDLLAATAGQNPNRAADFSRFQKSLAVLREHARDVDRAYQRAVDNSNAFYQAWTAESRRGPITDRLELEQQIRTRLSSRADALAFFDRGRQRYLDMVTNMSGIESSLAGDLSDANVLAQNARIQNAIAAAFDTRIFVDRLDEVLDAASTMR